MVFKRMHIMASVHAMDVKIIILKEEPALSSVVALENARSSKRKS